MLKPFLHVHDTNHPHRLWRVGLGRPAQPGQSLPDRRSRDCVALEANRPHCLRRLYAPHVGIQRGPVAIGEREGWKREAGMMRMIAGPVWFPPQCNLLDPGVATDINCDMARTKTHISMSKPPYGDEVECKP